MKVSLVLLGILFLTNVNTLLAETDTKVLFSCLKKDAPAESKRIEIREVDGYYLNLVYEGSEDDQKIFGKPYRWNMTLDNITQNDDEGFEAKYKRGFVLDVTYHTNILQINLQTGEGEASFYMRSLSGCGGFEKEKDSIKLVDCKAL